MSLREFGVRLRGLSDSSLFLKAAAADPKPVNSPEGIAGLFGTYLGGPATTE